MEHLIARTVSGLILLLIIAASSLAGPWDYNPAVGEAIKLKVDVTDDVSGTGYYMEYKKANTNNLSLWEYSHGSGSMDFADILYAEQKTTHSANYIYWINYDTGKWTRKYPGANSQITYTRQYDNVQSPTSFAYGTGWYAAHPVAYNSLLKDKTRAKSYQEAIGMERQVEYAHALKGDIAVDLNCTAPTATVSGKGLASMKIDDDVTQGMLDIGMFVGRPLQSTYSTSKKRWNPKLQGWHNPLTEIDTHYIGSFQVQKTMKVEISKSAPTWMEDWLPCCMGGFFDVPSHNFDKERGSHKGIFDCSCRNTSISTMQPKWNASLAQFPMDAYRYKP